jgi:hypothetical protein
VTKQLYPLVSLTVRVTQFRRAIDRCVVDYDHFVHVREKLEDSIEDSLNCPFFVKGRYDQAKLMILHKKLMAQTPEGI